MKQTNRFVIIILILFFTSCRTITVREIELDETQPLTHNIESLTETNIKYTINGKDTTKFETVIIQHFNKKNNLIKQIDYYPKNKTHTTYFNYNAANLLVNETSKNQDSIEDTRSEYFYDKKNRVIEWKNFSKNKSWIQKLTEYDSKGNRVMQRLNSSKPNSSDWITLFEYNYKKRFFTYKTLDSNYVAKYKTGNKTYFDKRGYLIKSETYADEEFKNLTGYSTYKYDKAGNRVWRKSYGKDGTVKSESYYVNIYDSVGNIIQRDHYYENRILETSKIVYKYRK
ncbi:hypothetical protein WFZ85_09155 [Flavobacterium sp. j3]|uniref:YD repeat-containing protein n=1 Tax=Flavobacterium aureirubrum TaxID=3133147 RepID=A0ABU9N5S8_9FLAO